MVAGRPRKFRKPQVFTTKFESDILHKYQELMRLEGRHTNDGLQEHMDNYVLLHGGQLPADILDRWIQDPQYLVTSALQSKSGVLRQILEGCDNDTLERVLDALSQVEQMVIQVRRNQARKKSRQEWERKSGVAAPHIDAVFEEAIKRK